MVKKNYNYGRLIDGKLEFAPNRIKGTVTNEDGKQISVQIINGSADKYLAQGWYPIVKTDMPEPTEQGYYASEYEFTNGQIVQSWKFVEYEPQE